MEHFHGVASAPIACHQGFDALMGPRATSIGVAAGRLQALV
jgi:hypothetical protein